MPSYKPRANTQTACPHCRAGRGAPCSDAEGRVLAGVHFQRLTVQRREIRAALGFYAGLGLRGNKRG